MTNKIVLRTVDEFMGGYVNTYNPMYGLFMNGAKQYSQEFGVQTFRRAEVIGDIRAKQFTPKDTELKQIAVREGSKTFKKFFLGNQFIQSSFQDQQGLDDTIAAVLDEHQKQADDILLGDGINSGLYTSTDSNYLLEGSAEVAKSGSSYVEDLYSKMLSEYQKADAISGQKMIILYGSTLMPVYNALFSNVARPFRSVLQEALPGVQIVNMPSDVTPSGANGFMIVNMDQIQLHWTALPQLKASGLNEEKGHYWFNFLLGSMLVDLKAANAIIRQPLTLAA